MATVCALVVMMTFWDAFKRRKAVGFVVVVVFLCGFITGCCS